MGQILDLNKQKNKNSTSPPTKEESLVQKLLREIFKNSNNLSDLLVCTKDNEGELQLYHTDLDIRDRSYIIQILQSDVSGELSPTEDMGLSSDS